MNLTLPRRIGWCLTPVALVVPILLASPPQQPCQGDAGSIDTITIGGHTAYAVTIAQMSIARGSAAASAASAGLPLCFSDIITTGPDVAAQLKLTSAAAPGVMLFPNTTTQLVDSSSLFLKLGRIFVSLRGKFDIRTIFGNLSARGTEFQVESGENLNVVLIEGALDVAPPGAEPAPAPSAVAAVPPSRVGGRAVAIAQRGAGAAAARMAAAATVPQWAAVTIQPRSQLTIDRVVAPRVAPAGRDLCKAAMDANSDFIAATRPVEPRQNSIKAFARPEARAAAYRDARFAAAWDPAPSAYEALGNVYADWGEAVAAVRAFAEADKRDGGRVDARGLNARGNATRLAGDLDAAEGFYKRAMQADPSFAFPRNGLGDVFRDRALAAADQKQMSSALALIDKAQEEYKASLSPELWGKEGGPNRAVALVNLGDAFRLRAEWTAASGRPQDLTQAGRDLGNAKAAYDESKGQGNEFTQIGYARLEMAQAGLSRAQKNSSAAGASLARARSLLQELVGTHPNFSAAHETLGEVLIEQGDTKGALPFFQRAVALDPGYAAAYFHLGRAMVDLKLPGGAQYLRAYQTFESPIFSKGERMNIAVKQGGSVAAMAGRGGSH